MNLKTLILSTVAAGCIAASSVAMASGLNLSVPTGTKISCNGNNVPTFLPHASWVIVKILSHASKQANGTYKANCNIAGGKGILEINSSYTEGLVSITTQGAGYTATATPENQMSSTVTLTVKKS